MSKTLSVAKTGSEGIVMERAFVVQQKEIRPRNYTPADKENEKKKFHLSAEKVGKELEIQAEKDAIFAAHYEIATDEEWTASILDKIEQGSNAELGLWDTAEDYILIFESMDDDYMRERAADVIDVRNRILCAMQGESQNPFEGMFAPSIVVAKDLAPSETAQFRLEFVKGIVTQEGGLTGHVSIMAKNMGIPILVGVKGILDEVKHGDFLILDAGKGMVMVEPDEKTCHLYEAEKSKNDEQDAIYKQMEGVPVVTKTGKTVKVFANVGSIAEIKAANERKIFGSGLFRSEFLYMNCNHFPEEEEQYQVYQEAATLCQEELIIRTLDIGGDKELPYFTFPKEENPFLGWRAIRICLELKSMFKQQLRAVLRAAVHGNVKLMFPMIISIEELREAKSILEECKCELREEKIAYCENIPVGMMIETPSSVLLAEEFAKEVDFFSIGTNDLTQYILAVDRGNSKIADKYDYFHPAVLKSIEKVIEAGHKAGILVGMCGEMAGDEKAIPMLLEMGLDEFSVAASTAAKVKYWMVQCGA